MYLEPALFIGGAARSASETARNIVVNPATGKELATLPIATAEDVADAIKAAHAAFPAWSRTTPLERARILRAAAALIRERVETIATNLTLENGKPLADARGEMLTTAEIFDWFADEARRAYGRIIPGSPDARMLVMKEPIGVAAVMSPWNYPAVTSGKKIAAALAAGCTVVAKPAEETPSAPIAIAQCLAEAGLPAGALNVLFGRPAEISAAIMASPLVAKVSFTGSTTVGRELARLAAPGLKRLTMELGGHAPVIVMDDVDVEWAAKLSVAGKFRNAGQVCTSATRFFVHQSIYERFAARFAELSAAIKVGDGLDPATMMGPLSNARRAPALEALIEDATAAGARLLTGGKRLPGPGYFFAPTVLADVPAHARVMTEEPFGPLAALVPFTDLDEAILAANAVPFGLAAYTLTNSIPLSRRIARELRSGVVGINTFTASGPETPFGGVKASGYGIEGGLEGLESYLVTKFVNEG